MSDVRCQRFDLDPGGFARIGPEVVYCVKAERGDWWKVGLSTNVLQRLVGLEENLRLVGLEENLPFRVRVAFLIRVDGRSIESLERRFLERIEEWQVRGEWHEVPPVEMPFFVWRLDRAMPRGATVLWGPEATTIEANLSILEDLGIETTRKHLPRWERPLFENAADLMEQHLVEDRVSHAQWHMRQRLGLPP